MDSSQRDFVGLSYRTLTSAERDTLQEIKERGQAFIAFIDGLGRSEAIDIARVRAEESVMWAVKHLTSAKG
ncbi:hypothetical protein [Mesorhizobium sp. CAU 1741]|uniref:Acb2/Tad1 domain-containing protein n=1 Tax=Mesorhizobium sp. CAU 1741 TaxID=3140366 RepID=UPI00325B0607